MPIPADTGDSLANAYFLLAGICTVVMLWMLLHTVFPKWRPDWTWDERPGGIRVSGVGFAAYAIAAGLWAVSALAAGFRYAPIIDFSAWIVVLGFVIVICAGLYDLRRPR
ncbi:MAG TPA: hypothetical protein VGW39_00105 [Chthoniobacterales bacterium]|nr:hypothetical protein [Chthoniobacterales bacterium]